MQLGVVDACCKCLGCERPRSLFSSNLSRDARKFRLASDQPCGGNNNHSLRTGSRIKLSTLNTHGIEALLGIIGWGSALPTSSALCIATNELARLAFRCNGNDLGYSGSFASHMVTDKNSKGWCCIHSEAQRRVAL